MCASRGSSKSSIPLAADRPGVKCAILHQNSASKNARVINAAILIFGFSVCGGPLLVVRRHDGRRPGGAALTAVLVAAWRRRE
jgi:hypothetical protein